MGGAGQGAIGAATVLLHGEAPLCARYLAAAGIGRLLYTGVAPELAARDPEFRMEAAGPGAPADVVVDLGDGRAAAAAKGTVVSGAAEGRRIVLGPGAVPAARVRAEAVARALLETLASGEALRALCGHPPHRYEFTL